MKSMFKLIAQIVFVASLTVATTATAATSPNTEADKIMQAMKLYSEAAAIDQFSAEKTEMLVRAETILLDVVKKNPASLDAYRKLMGVYLQKRDYAKAIQAMQSAITLSPEDPKLFVALAILYDHQGAYEYALPILEQALELDPNLQLAKDYKASMQQKIEMQNIAMESTTPPPHETNKPHSMEKRLSE